MRKREDTDEARMMARMHKSLVKPYTDASIKWEGDHEGVVTNVIKRGTRTEVHVRTEEPAEVGDKLAGRHGNKGIITKIIPDAEMPKTKDEKPVEILSTLVDCCSDEGAIVLDPFMGSGSTGVACANMGRHFIGTEIDPEYHAVAKGRF
jgi:DNA modification methylase